MKVLRVVSWTLLSLTVLFSAAGNSFAQGQKGLVLSGKVYNGLTKQPVEFGTVIVLEAKVKANTEPDGSYRVTIKEPGEYTVIVRSPELQPVKAKVSIAKSFNRNFFLQPLTIKGEGITITGVREIQKVSRYTMTVKELKEVPGSLGDSVTALSSMPGVIRTDGIFGPLVVRGMNPIWNRYLIDDIPIYNPLHFGGIHSVINNNLMSEIDLYSSAFPAKYGSGNGALIAINTVDDVKEFGGYTDVGLISASALIQAPILKDKNGSIHFAPPSYLYRENDGYQNVGYIIASGRVGYMSIFIPPIYKVVTGDDLTYIPEYWDYQVKAKYYITSRQSLTLLFMGSSDYWSINEDEIDGVQESEGDDPLISGFTAKADYSSHSQGIYYAWEPSDRFSNKIIAYGALIRYKTYFNLPDPSAASWLKDINIDSRPYIFGAREMFRAEPWEDHLVINGGVEYTYYYFTAKGKTFINRTGGSFDPGNENEFTSIYLDEHIINQTLGGHLQTKFTYGWLSVEPGVRFDYLSRTQEITVDPRGLVTVEFPTDTTLSAAGGQYSYFFQTNPYLFNQLPQVAALGEGLKPERGIHRVVGIEQRFLQDYSVKVEGFYNTFRDLAQAYYHYEPDGTPIEGMSSGRAKMYGFEVMIKKELRENENGFYGWINYTYTHSRYRSGLPTQDGLYGFTTEPQKNYAGDAYGDQWIVFEYEQVHSLKLVAGYTVKPAGAEGRHTFSIKFQYYSGSPYTPIVGSTPDSDYYLATGKNRYVPQYGKTNSENYVDNHQLDFRYSYRVDYSWGYVSWYVEIINLTGMFYRPRNDYHWDYRYPYSDVNPRMQRQPEDDLSWIPNFGVEIKF